MLVFGGVPVTPSPFLRRRLSTARPPFVVAADGGVLVARELGFPLSVVVGDFDSLPEGTEAGLRQCGVPVEQHPRDKDETDGELAIRRALLERPDELLIVGFLGGPRLDHAVANLALLDRIPVSASLLDGENECRLLRAGEAWEWTAESGELVSLVPFRGDATGVTTAGLRWRLAAANLPFGSTRGVSNEPVEPTVSVRLDGGTLLVLRHVR